jgi:hypothetical protein
MRKAKMIGMAQGQSVFRSFNPEPTATAADPEKKHRRRWLRVKRILAYVESLIGPGDGERPTDPVSRGDKMEMGKVDKQRQAGDPFRALFYQGRHAPLAQGVWELSLMCDFS